ncbi:hypothetical protein MTO96_022798 [Rhipicephalus appendiculatus]
MLQDTCTIVHDPLPDMLYTGSPLQTIRSARAKERKVGTMDKVRAAYLAILTGKSRPSLLPASAAASNCPCPSTFHSDMVTLTLRLRSSLVCNDPDLGDRAWITCGPCSVDWYVVCIDHVFPLLFTSSPHPPFSSWWSYWYAQCKVAAVLFLWVHASPGSGVQVLPRKFVCHKEIEFVSCSGKPSGLH